MVNWESRHLIYWRVWTWGKLTNLNVPRNDLNRLQTFVASQNWFWHFLHGWKFVLTHKLSAQYENIWVRTRKNSETTTDINRTNPWAQSFQTLTKINSFFNSGSIGKKQSNELNTIQKLISILVLFGQPWVILSDDPTSSATFPIAFLLSKNGKDSDSTAFRLIFCQTFGQFFTSSSHQLNVINHLLKNFLYMSGTHHNWDRGKQDRLETFVTSNNWPSLFAWLKFLF